MESTYEQGRRIYPTGGEIKSLYLLKRELGFRVHRTRVPLAFRFRLVGRKRRWIRAGKTEGREPAAGYFPLFNALYFPNFVRYRVPPAKLHHPLLSRAAFFRLSPPPFPLPLSRYIPTGKDEKGIF